MFVSLYEFVFNNRTFWYHLAKVIGVSTVVGLFQKNPRKLLTKNTNLAIVV